MATKKQTRKSNEQEKGTLINFPLVAGDYSFFNSYEIEEKKGIFSLKLFFEDTSAAYQVFHGMITLEDCNQLIPNFQSYIGKIGFPQGDAPPPPRGVTGAVGPKTFHHIGLINKDPIGEFIVSQFSHKIVWDAATQGDPSIEAVTYGVYTSHTDTHKRLVIDFVDLAKAAASKRISTQ